MGISNYDAANVLEKRADLASFGYYAKLMQRHMLRDQ